MAGIWTNTGDGWKLADSQPFPDEATLQGLVAENPQLLPLAGSPSVFTFGREVRLGTGKADILAVEASGRPVIIEVKLARNAEARRAIVSQVLAYAAFCMGTPSKTSSEARCATSWPVQAVSPYPKRLPPRTRKAPLISQSLSRRCKSI